MKVRIRRCIESEKCDLCDVINDLKLDVECDNVAMTMFFRSLISIWPFISLFILTDFIYWNGIWEVNIIIFICFVYKKNG